MRRLPPPNAPSGSASGSPRRTPDAFEPDLAMSLNNLANRLAEVGRRDEALARSECLKNGGQSNYSDQFCLEWRHNPL